mmetsp:Transcript_35970/g.58157  ORF Transcript_35970/g.58157 Transcript_35970/m.58157 type:complete len:725 (+) Transcript_35970:210-2384(+)|eukprot:CAMPEP_0184676382 /NCGR_PEP_ID=MMETSP0308-20130426/88318_1 /TAXON_ID=38269 /ORGANISM="Gloeochaete witrockiana, Strain SAG 46.84" /LENGTH=724 /DNA_ID=CAMNT_0027124209 /DNA_START=87 /DNA_END=2261 /DNA_ORIENTATION=+
MGVNIIVPMGGLHSHFSSGGYRFPKPLINIVGRPMLFWVLDNLDLEEGDTLWLGIMKNMESEFEISRRVLSEYPHIRVKPVLLDFQTRGAAETVYIVLQNMEDEDLDRPTISLDCDTIYVNGVEILRPFRELPPKTGCTFVFQENKGSARFSYVTVENEETMKIIDIKEKASISHWANTGAYGFCNGRLLKWYCMLSLDTAIAGTSKEYFLSAVIARMLKDENSFQAVPLDPKAFACVGDPEQLNEFLRRIAHGEVHVKRKLRFCFDLDKTLVTSPLVPGDYSTVQPKWRNIKLVRQLKEVGHYVIIWTARRMRTHAGNIGRVIADVGAITFRTLEQYNIPYDEIHFGKPYANVYVDDSAVNALLDTEKEVGWWVPDEDADEKRREESGHVACRHFNKVQVLNDVVIKSSSTQGPGAIAGEVYWYQMLLMHSGSGGALEPIKDLFPRPIHIDLIEQRHQCAITMERINGVTFTHLVLDRCLTAGRLLKLLKALKRLHSCQGVRMDRELKVNIYENGTAKVNRRYEQYRTLYETLGEGDGGLAIKNRITALLSDYEAEQRGLRGMCIHGDPVFSNEILTIDDRVVFLDMRGIVGTTPTLQGDIMYDLAKVYQCLSGYDFIIMHSRLPSEAEYGFLQRLQVDYWSFVSENYPTVPPADIRMLCASLLFSLIPLHDNLVHRPLFLALCKKVLAELDSTPLATTPPTSVQNGLSDLNTTLATVSITPA